MGANAAILGAMGTSTVLAGHLPSVIVAFTTIPAAIALAVIFWAVRKPLYDGARAFGLAVIAGVIAFILLAIRGTTA